MQIQFRLYALRKKSLDWGILWGLVAGTNLQAAEKLKGRSTERQGTTLELIRKLRI
jgi:hypothetical protein